MMHLTLKRLEAPGSLEVWWGGGGRDILMKTEGQEEVWDVEQSGWIGRGREWNMECKNELQIKLH